MAKGTFELVVAGTDLIEVPDYLTVGMGAEFPAEFWTALDDIGDLNGDSIRVYESDGVTEVSYFIVNIDVSSTIGRLIFAPGSEAANGFDTTYVIEAGDDTLPAASDSLSVFSGTSYVGVYFPGESVNDATTGGRNLTAINAPGTAAVSQLEMDAATYSAASSKRHVYEGTAAISTWPATLESIVNPSVVTGTEIPFALGASGGSSLFGWYRDSSNFHAAIQGDGGSVGSVQTGTVSASTNYYVAITRDSNGGTTYGYNGGTQYSNTADINAASGLDRTTIGAYGTSSYAYHWTGDVAYAAISDEVRSTDYVATMYKAWFDSAFWAAGVWTEAGGGTESGDGDLSFAALSITSSVVISRNSNSSISFASLEFTGLTTLTRNANSAIIFAGMVISSASEITKLADSTMLFSGVELAGAASALRQSTSALQFGHALLSSQATSFVISSASITFTGFRMFASNEAVLPDDIDALLVDTAASALRRHLCADPIIIKYLGQWEFTTGVVQPSIHLESPPPPEAATPTMVILDDSGSEWVQGSNRKDKYEQWQCSVRVFGRNLENTFVPAIIADRVYRLLYSRSSFPLPCMYNWTVLRTDCSTPQLVYDELGIPGYQITVTLVATYNS